MDLDNLRDEIIGQFGDHWLMNDKAHRDEHFEEVFKTGVYINQKLGLGYDEKLIMFAAYFHDMFAWSRVNHHQLSHLWVMTTDHPLIVENLDEQERYLVSQGCLQHRASFKEGFSCDFAVLINAADRGFPGNVDAMLKRAMQYREARDPMQSVEDRRRDSILHLKEKFGHGGYARYPDVYERAFGEQLELQREAIGRLE